MRLRYVAYLCFSVLLMCSCNDDDENLYYGASTDAQIYSFSVSATHEKTGDPVSRAEDSLRFKIFSGTVFSIDQKNSVIFNRDSLPYGLVPRKVMMKVTYNTTYGVKQLEVSTGSSEPFVWNSKDSVDFSQEPIKFTVTAPDGITQKTYTLKLNIYTRDPDVIVWGKVAGASLSNAGEQKVLLNNNKFYSYSKSSSSVYLDTCSYSYTPTNWGENLSLNLPLNVKLESVHCMDGIFFAVTEDGGSYTSVDGVDWNNENNGFDVKAIYGVLPKVGGNILLLAFKEDDKYYWGTTSDMKSINKISKISTSPNDPTIKDGFPIDRFASATDYKNGNAGYLVLTGGFDSKNTALSRTWLAKLSGDVLEITPSSETPFFEGEGVSIFFYDGLLFTLYKNEMYYSRTWGDSWTVVSTKQSLPANMEERKSQSLMVDDKNIIWIFGGISFGNEILSDVWRGRLNRLSVN